jgi:hypothetical protein
LRLLHDSERLLQEGQSDRRDQLSGKKCRLGAGNLTRCRDRPRRLPGLQNPPSRSDHELFCQPAGGGRLRGGHATIVSNSWGGGESSSETSNDGHFNHIGTPITFSSGDGGYGVEYPAASQYVTAVGGTTLNLNADNTYKSESVWSGAGSGCSAYEPKPTWQTDAGCGLRTVADVAADANPNTGAAVYDTVRYQGRSGWFQVGGTSLASPLVAAVYALAGNATSTVDGQYPYLHTTSLHDVTSGSNGRCGGSYLCTGVVGYDGPTGNGTPNGTSAF